MQFDSSSFEGTKHPELVFRALLHNEGNREARFLEAQHV
jgi:hypothetical protein